MLLIFDFGCATREFPNSFGLNVLKTELYSHADKEYKLALLLFLMRIFTSGRMISHGFSALAHFCLNGFLLHNCKMKPILVLYFDLNFSGFYHFCGNYII